MENNEKKEKTVSDVKKRIVSDAEYSCFGEFKIKRVRLLIDINGHSRELSPGAKINDKFLRREKVAVVNAVKIADKQEAWSIRIPETFDIAGIILSLYEGEEKDDEKILRQLLFNYANVTTNTDGLFHSLVLNCGTIYHIRRNDALDFQQKKKEYFKILRSIVKALSADIEEQRKKMEESNAAFEDLMEGKEGGN